MNGYCRVNLLCVQEVLSFAYSMSLFKNGQAFLGIQYNQNRTLDFHKKKYKYTFTIELLHFLEETGGHEKD